MLKEGRKERKKETIKAEKRLRPLIIIEYDTVMLKPGLKNVSTKDSSQFFWYICQMYIMRSS